jgi:hypothetical protein
MARLAETRMLLWSEVCKCGQHFGETQILQRSFVTGIHEAIYYAAELSKHVLQRLLRDHTPSARFSDGKISSSSHDYDCVTLVAYRGRKS